MLDSHFNYLEPNARLLMHALVFFSVIGIAKIIELGLKRQFFGWTEVLIALVAIVIKFNIKH